MIRAARKGNLATVWQQVDSEFGFLARGGRNQTLLQAAVMSDNAEMIAFILDNGCEASLESYDA